MTETFPNEREAKKFARAKLVDTRNVSAGTLNPLLPKRTIAATQMLEWLEEPGDWAGRLTAPRSDEPQRKAWSRECCGEGSIPRQDVDFTKLLLKLLDTLDAIRVSFSEALGGDGRPAPIAWYDRNRDWLWTVIK
jgi:hypothetical protein